MTRPTEEGFTLVELLITTVIIGFVVSAVTASLVVGLKTTDDTNKRLSESHDAQMASVYFAADAQNADDVSLSDPTCGGAPLVRFHWKEDGPAKDKVASYAVVEEAGERRLVRHYCENGVPLNKVVVVHGLGPSGPVVSCDPPTGVPGCSVAPFKPGSVTLEVTAESGYAFSLSGTRRTS